MLVCFVGAEDVSLFCYDRWDGSLFCYDRWDGWLFCCDRETVVSPVL